MRTSNVSLFLDADMPVCHINTAMDGTLCVTINDHGKTYGSPKVDIFMTKIQWIEFKNSVLAAHDKMFGKR